MTASLPTPVRARKPARPISGWVRWNVQPTAAHCGVLVIGTNLANGKQTETAYEVTEIRHPGGQVLGYRLRKPDGEAYDLDTSAEHWVCQCKDYEYRRAGRDPKGCRHVAGLKTGLAALA